MHILHRFALFLIAACALSTVSSSAFSHPNHGMQGSHWHSTDVLGFVAVACLVGLAYWLINRDK
jgi:hypothetical protein